MDTEGFPPVSPQLVERLSKVFPDQCPEPAYSDREIWMAVGRAQVVRKLRQVSAEQHTTVLANT